MTCSACNNEAPGGIYLQKRFDLCDMHAGLENSELLEQIASKIVVTSRRWSLVWPTKAGLYLFYGRIKGTTQRMLQMVTVADTAVPGVVIHLGNTILYPEEFEGIWSPFDEKTPDAWFEELVT